MQNKIWQDHEYIVTFNLYLRLPFGKMDHRTPEVVELANLLNRTPSSIAMRLSNFAHVDPFHQNRGIKGLKGGKKQCQPIFDRYISNRENLMYESELILAKLENKTLEKKYERNFLDIKDFKGLTKERIVKTRVNQNLFRKIILANYNYKCAISGIDMPSVLIASHIKPWGDDENNRLNPENGICLDAFYDKCFDRGLIGFDRSYAIVFSDYLKKSYQKDYFKKYFKPIEGKKISLPERFLPNLDFLAYHLENYFNKELL
jgi:putative restriction endonuclease